MASDVAGRLCQLLGILRKPPGAGDAGEGSEQQERAAALSPFNSFETIEYRQALSTDARVSLHEAMDAAAGTELLASNTGGLRVSGDLKQGLTRILDTTKTYYVLGYEPPQKKKPGFRKIKVAVKAKGLKVLARRGYFDDRRPDQSGASPSGRPPR